MCVCVCVSTVSATICNKVSTKGYVHLQRNMGNTFIMVFSKNTYIYVIYVFECICIYIYIYIYVVYIYVYVPMCI